MIRSVSVHSKFFFSSLVNLVLHRRGSRIVSGTIFKKDTNRSVWKIKWGQISVFLELHTGTVLCFCFVICTHVFIWTYIIQYTCLLYIYSSWPISILSESLVLEMMMCMNTWTYTICYICHLYIYSSWPLSILSESLVSHDTFHISSQKTFRPSL